MGTHFKHVFVETKYKCLFLLISREEHNTKQNVLDAVYVFLGFFVFVFCLNSCLMKHQPLSVILCCLPEKGRKGMNRGRVQIDEDKRKRK